MARLRRKTAAEDAWDDLSLPWRSAFALAWEAYRVRTAPVGAVLVDAAGRIVARGRNHVFGDTGQVLDGILAHAEVVTLARLSPLDRHEDLTLYTTVEPCLLCLGAATAATIGAVRYAGAEPYAGAAGFPLADTPHSRRRPLAVEGPLPGPFGALASAMHLELYLRLNPTGRLADTYRERSPEIAGLAEALLATDTLRKASTGRVGFSDLVAEIWPLLPA